MQTNITCMYVNKLGIEFNQVFLYQFTILKVVRDQAGHCQCCKLLFPTLIGDKIYHLVIFLAVKNCTKVEKFKGRYRAANMDIKTALESLHNKSFVHIDKPPKHGIVISESTYPDVWP